VAIQIQEMTVVVARGRVYNTNGNDQVLHDQPLKSDNIKVCIMDLLDVNVYPPYPTDEMITVVDVIGSLIAWPMELIFLHA